jgi:hypothetical protein
MVKQRRTPRRSDATRPAEGRERRLERSRLSERPVAFERRGVRLVPRAAQQQQWLRFGATGR